jgi:uncharacterized repeat protein (TIGR03803 family)
MIKLNGWKKATIAFLFLAAAAITSPAQVTFTSLASFNTTNGSTPFGPVVQGLNGKLYGTTLYGGGFTVCEQGCGVVFDITPATGAFALDDIICYRNTSCTQGYFPSGSLLLASNGNFYGTAADGGTEQMGTVFSLSQSAQMSTLYNFCTIMENGDCADGFQPAAGMIQGTDGNFYGTTTNGGPSLSYYGTIFKITAAGKLITLSTFCVDDGCPGGYDPHAALVQASNGNYYGTTLLGANSSSDCSSKGCGAIFEITPAGKLTALHNFCSLSNCADGANPYAGLVQASDGNLYGATQFGGTGGTANNCLGNCGTIFRITPAGELTTLYNFCSQPNCADGNQPLNTLIVGSDGNLYGTTYAGGTSATCVDGCGTIFEITLTGELTTLYSFALGDGQFPNGLFQATDGNFYGTTAQGGIFQNTCLFGCGAAYRLSTGLSPFVQTIPAAGKTDSSVLILGTDLTGSTAVSFNGKAATFTVVSATEIKATVPSGATTGSVTVTTPTGILNSNTEFRIVE